MMDFADKTVLVWDNGLFVHVAEKLAESFGRVLYFCNAWRSTFPTSALFNVGNGLPGIERVESPFPFIEAADLIVFPDVGFGGEQEFLRGLGKRVWGSGDGELLELHRDELKATLEAVGLPVGPYGTVRGVTALREYLRDHPGSFVKTSVFRGDLETFCNTNDVVTQPLVDDLAATLGPRREEIDFIVEEPIEGVECGYDGVSIDGQFPPTGLWGYEAKDAGYIAQGVPYDDIPAPIREVNDKLGPILGALNCRGFFSTEVRVTPEGSPYMMDPAVRCGSPPSELYMEMVTNWPEVMWEGAVGNVVDLELKAQYGAQVVLKSDWVLDHFLAVDIPEGMRRWIKLHAHCRLGDKDYVAPFGAKEFGAAIGIGDTMKQAVDNALKHAEAVSALELDYDGDALNSVMNQIEKGVKNGIDW